MKFINKSILVLFLLLGLSVNAQQESKNQNDRSTLQHYLTSKGYVRIKMEKLASGHLHLTGILNGVKGNFILDTGATGTVIEVKNKEKFKMLSRASERQASGAGSTNMRMQASSKNNFDLGNIKLLKLNLMLMNLDHVNKAFKRFNIAPVDGVIGADILTRKKAIIDYIDLSLYLKK